MNKIIFTITDEEKGTLLATFPEEANLDKMASELTQAVTSLFVVMKDVQAIRIVGECLIADKQYRIGVVIPRSSAKVDDGKVTYIKYITDKCTDIAKSIYRKREFEVMK